MRKKRSSEETDPIFAALGRACKARRNEKHMTIKELADSLGLTDDHVTKFEGGKAGISVPVLYKLALVLDMSVDAAMLPEYRETERHMKKIVFLAANNNQRLKAAFRYFDVAIKAAKESGFIEDEIEVPVN